MKEIVELEQSQIPSSIGKWKAYPAYKDSGVEWLGEIPAHWEVWKVARAFSLIGSGTTPLTSHEEYYDGDVPWVNTTELRDGIIVDTSKKLTYKAMLDYPTLRAYPTGTLLVALYGATIGKVGILQISATTNQACCAIFNSKKLIVDFTFYWFLAFRQQLILLASGGGQPNISQDIIRSLKIPTPLPSEQRAIASFLNRETGKINELIARKECLIELLQEKRAALISHAVTKGLDPDVKMRDSGVAWLGEIPEHWEAKKIKRLCQVKRGASPRPIDDPIYFNEDGEYAWVRISDVTASARYLLKTEQRLSTLGKSKSVCMEPGEIFLSIAGSVGKPIITHIKCCIHDGFVYFVNLRQNREYLFYIFSGGELYKGLGKLGTQLNLNTDTIGDIRIPIPPFSEQEIIVTYLDRETARIDALISRIGEAIEKLKEYSTALISAAVTGKIDVRDEV